MTYCTQNNGDCKSCGLSNYNRDCQNNPILTDKEDEILQLILQGKNNAEIAEQLGNTKQVIANAVKTIYTKTGCRDRIELILRGMR